MPDLSSSSRGVDSRDMVSLTERLAFLQALRVSFSVVVVATAALAPEVVGGPLDQIVLLTAAYLVISAMSEGARRLVATRGLGVVGFTLLFDGVYLAWVMYLTGGTVSPLRFLFYVHLVAVTLLASFRTGLKIALWHSLLFLSIYYAQASGMLEVREGIPAALPGAGPLFSQLSAFNVAALWIVAVGTAAFSALNERELRRRKDDLEILAAMAAELEETAEPTEVAATFLRALEEAFGIRRGLVLAGPDRRLSVLAFVGPGEPGPLPESIDPLLEKAWDEHEPVLVRQLDEASSRNLSSLMPFARNVVVVPLFAEGKPLGALVAEYPGSRIEKRVLGMVVQFASHAALALGNAWLLERVKRLAESDPLTGVANRRIFEAGLQRELSRSTRAGDFLAVAMIDLDHFKELNDTFGHQVGDEVLKAVAHALEHASRDFDIVARYGGEEFAVILPGCPPKESTAVADRLRRAISDLDLSELGVAAPITVSVGVAVYPSNAKDARALIAAADEALYASKRNGRNQITRSSKRTRGTAAPKS